MAASPSRAILIGPGDPAILQAACPEGLRLEVWPVVPAEPLSGLELAIVDLRPDADSAAIALGGRIREEWGAALVFIVPHDASHAVSAIEAARPDGILVEPLSEVQCRLVLALAPGRRGDALNALAPLAPLTRREKDVLRLFFDGRRVPSIARNCGVSEETVRAHLKSLYRKLGVKSQAELMDLRQRP
jgi:DNA-binding CsgD family transcriptional regulator